MSIDNSIQRVESEIDGKDGDAFANLRELLDEVKEFITLKSTDGFMWRL